MIEQLAGLRLWGWPVRLHRTVGGKATIIAIAVAYSVSAEIAKGLAVSSP
ncbi:hypothetical protein ABID62_003783 [Bradyrhizobium sp. S3.9.1]|jgi:hypothetical protein